MSEEKITYWYQEPWAWFVAAIPLGTVVACFFLVTILSEHSVELVVDDYYKKGKAINMQLDKIKQAKSWGISALVKVEDDRIVLDINKNSQAPEFPVLNIDFYHATMSVKDLNVTASKRGDGKYSAILDKKLTGNWRITVTPHDNSWKIQQKVSLPYSDTIILLPK